MSVTSGIMLSDNMGASKDAMDEEGKWLYRLVAVGRDSDTQVDYVKDDRVVIAPSLTWKPNADTSLTLQALQQRWSLHCRSSWWAWPGAWRRARPRAAAKAHRAA